MKTILDQLPKFDKQIREMTEIVLANLVMINELPAPTFEEHARVKFMVDRFTEYHLLNCSTDEVGNALGILPGTEGEKNILIAAHLDSIFDEKIDHTVSLKPNQVSGAGVADNALGLAAVVTLPLILEKLGIKLKSNLILMGSSRSLGRGNIEGIRFFLDNNDLPICAGVVIEGVKLGRISYSSIGMMRCEIKCRVPEEYDWSRFGSTSALVPINEVVNRILEIPLPRRPRTSIVLSSLNGGTNFNTLAKNADLRFEIRSESGRMVKRLKQEIESITAEVASHSGAELEFSVYAQRRPGGIPFSHPLPQKTRAIQKALDITPRISPSTSELSAFIARKIPAVTIGLTSGANFNQPNEVIDIDPINTGLSQLVSLILAIDGGYCGEN